MMQRIGRVAILAMVAGVLVGCGNGPVRTVAEPAELAAAEAVEVARVNYQFHLAALRDRMKAGGDIRKQTWASRELKNVTDAHTLQWKGIGTVTPPEATSLASANEALLVEYVVGARRGYLKALDDLMSIYQGGQDRDGITRVQGVLDAFNPVHTYLYYLSAEIPSPRLRGLQRQVPATQAFSEALSVYESASKPWVIGRSATVKHAAALKAFRGIIEKYPESNKISRCAFFIAEINRIYGEYERAAVWYDRSWQWNPQTTDPARYRAATLYDFKFKNARKALAYYRMVLQFETNYDNLEYARKRIRALGGDKTPAP